MRSGGEINWDQVAMCTAGGAISGSVLGNVGSSTASGAKEIAKNYGKVFLANGSASLVENTAYNLLGGDDLGTAVKSALISALIDGTTSCGTYALGQAARNVCFVEGIMVLTAEGLVAIECIVVGHMVMATNPETAEKKVKNTFVNETDELAHVFVDGEEIVCTPGHKFYAPEKGWISAIELRAGDQLQLVNGEYVTVEKVQHELLEEFVNVYNFEVEDFHTYYVGTDVQVLVHNTGCVNFTNHGYKHFPEKNKSWKEIVASTKSGPAKYSQEIESIEAFEREAWNSGIPVTNGKNWKVKKYDYIIGASNGKETQYVRIENSGGTNHGHPITEAEYKKLLR